MAPDDRVPTLQGYVKTLTMLVRLFKTVLFSTSRFFVNMLAHFTMELRRDQNSSDSSKLVKQIQVVLTEVKIL